MEPIEFGLKGIGLLNNFINTGIQAGVNQKNLEFQQGVFDYNKALQERIFEREDSSFQRHVSDVTKAGFSPLAALGGSAGAGQVISQTAPRKDVTQLPDFAQMASVLSLNNELKNGQVNRDLQKAEADSVKIKNSVDEWNLKYYKSRGMPTNMTGTERLIVDIAKALGLPTEKILSGDVTSDVVSSSNPGKIISNAIDNQADKVWPDRHIRGAIYGAIYDKNSSDLLKILEENPSFLPEARSILRSQKAWYINPYGEQARTNQFVDEMLSILDSVDKQN